MFYQKGFTTINIFGLTIGISCSLLIALYVYDEVRYDSFHEGSDSIYRLSYQTRLQGKDNHTSLTPAGLSSVAASVSGIASTTRVAAWKTFPIRYEGNSYTEKYLLLADSNFFEFFSIYLFVPRTRCPVETGHRARRSPEFKVGDPSNELSCANANDVLVNVVGNVNE